MDIDGSNTYSVLNNGAYLYIGVPVSQMNNLTLGSFTRFLNFYWFCILAKSPTISTLVHIIFLSVLFTSNLASFSNSTIMFPDGALYWDMAPLTMLALWLSSFKDPKYSDFTHVYNFFSFLAILRSRDTGVKRFVRWMLLIDIGWDCKLRADLRSMSIVLLRIY